MKKTILFALLMIVAGSASAARLMLPFTEYYGTPGYNPMKQHYGLDCVAYCEERNLCVRRMISSVGMPRTAWTAWPHYRAWVYADLDGFDCYCGRTHPTTGDCSIPAGGKTPLRSKAALCGDGAKPKPDYGCDVPIFEYDDDIEEYDTPPEVVD